MLKRLGASLVLNLEGLKQGRPSVENLGYFSFYFFWLKNYLFYYFFLLRSFHCPIEGFSEVFWVLSEIENLTKCKLFQ